MRYIIGMILWPAFVTALFLSANCVAAEPMPVAQATPNLTVLVDENLLLPAAQLARLYSSKTGTPLTIVAKNAAEAEQQIEQGLEAHVMLSANAEKIELLAGQGLLDVSSTRAFTRSQLALVATPTLDKQDVLAKRISFAAMIAATPELPVFINAPDTPEGKRAASLLKGQSFSEALAARVQVKQSREEVLAAMRETGGLGLMLAADAIGQPDVRVISVLSPEVSPPVIYQAVVLASESMASSRQFTQFLQTRAAQEVFSHFGLQAAGN